MKIKCIREPQDTYLDHFEPENRSAYNCGAGLFKVVLKCASLDSLLVIGGDNCPTTMVNHKYVLSTQCKNSRIFLPYRFYVKSTSKSSRRSNVKKCLFLQFRASTCINAKLIFTFIWVNKNPSIVEARQCDSGDIRHFYPLDNLLNFEVKTYLEMVDLRQRIESMKAM